MDSHQRAPDSRKQFKLGLIYVVCNLCIKKKLVCYVRRGIEQIQFLGITGSRAVTAFLIATLRSPTTIKFFSPECYTYPSVIDYCPGVGEAPLVA
jgi:hypothetical protein